MRAWPFSRWGAVLGATLALGACGGDDRGGPASTIGSASAVTTSSPFDGGTAQLRPVAARTERAPTSSPALRTMSADRFWRLISRAHRSPRRLHAELMDLSRRDLIGFERRHERVMERAYSWDLWGAGYLRFGGMSDDSFEYFRAYLVSLGRRTFEQVLADPDSLADVRLGSEEGWEDWTSPTLSVVHARTGRYDFADPDPPADDVDDEPSGKEWDEEDLPRRYPRIEAKFG